MELNYEIDHPKNNQTEKQASIEKTKSAQKILDSNLSEFNEDFEVEKKNMKIGLVVNFLGAIISLGIFYIMKNYPINRINFTFVETLLLFTVSSLFVYFIISFLYFSYTFKSKTNNSNISFILSNNSFLIRISMTLFLMKYFFYSFFQEIKNSFFVDTEIEQKIVEIITHKTKPFISVLLIISSFLLVKRVFIQSVEHRIHYKFYRYRIKENEKIVKYLKKLNVIAGNNIYSSYEKWAEHIFECLVNTTSSDVLRKSDFISYFENEEGTEIFELFDTNCDSTVSREEFITRYVSLFRERYNLRKALHKNDGVMNKLEHVVYIILVPTLVVSIYVTFSDHKTFIQKFGFIGTAFFSLSFAFSKILSDLVSCIVFIYFVRPFDIGDMIELNGKILRVKSLGLMATNFHEEGLGLHSISNNKLKESDVINYREVVTKYEQIVKSFKYNSCFDKMDVLHRKIDKYLRKNKNKFRKKFNIYKFNINKDVIKMTFEINIICKYQELEAMYKRKDEFSVFLHKSVEELNFEYAG